MKIETAKEAWAALINRNVLKDVDGVPYRIHRTWLEYESLKNEWLETSNIGTGPWTVYKEPKKKPIKLPTGFAVTPHWDIEDVMGEVAIANQAINWLLDQHKES